MKPLSRHAYAVLAIVLSIVIFVAVNMAADTALTTAKLDLTANGQFTLAQGTRNILANLKEPVTLKFYYSKQVASEYATTADYAKRVRDLLGEYASLSHGNIVVQEIDPEPFTEAEDQVVPLLGIGQDMAISQLGPGRTFARSREESPSGLFLPRASRIPASPLGPPA